MLLFVHNNTNIRILSSILLDMQTANPHEFWCNTMLLNSAQTYPAVMNCAIYTTLPSGYDCDYKHKQTDVSLQLRLHIYNSNAIQRNDVVISEVYIYILHKHIISCM